MALLCLLVVTGSSAYLRLDPSEYFDRQRAVYVLREGPLLLHIGGAMVALALLPLQMSSRLRARRPRLHRAVGRLYLGGVLVGAVGGLLLSTTALGGRGATAGFAALAVAWLLTGALGLAAILRGDVEAHRRWMTRSFAVTFSAVTLRLYLGVFTVLADAGLTTVAYETAYVAISWLAWVPNLALAWWWTTRPASRGTTADAASPAPVARSAA